MTAIGSAPVPAPRDHALVSNRLRNSVELADVLEGETAQECPGKGWTSHSCSARASKPSFSLNAPRGRAWHRRPRGRHRTSLIRATGCAKMGSSRHLPGMASWCLGESNFPDHGTLLANTPPKAYPRSGYRLSVTECTLLSSELAGRRDRIPYQVHHQSGIPPQGHGAHFEPGRYQCLVVMARSVARSIRARPFDERAWELVTERTSYSQRESRSLARTKTGGCDTATSFHLTSAVATEIIASVRRCGGQVSHGSGKRHSPHRVGRADTWLVSCVCCQSC